MPLVWLVMGVRVLSLAPDGILWWGFTLGILYHGILWVFRFGGNEPARREARAIVSIVTVMIVLVVSRLTSDDRPAWLLAVPAALVVASLLGGQMATGHALWTTHVLTAPAGDRQAARARWLEGSGTAELLTIRTGRVVVAVAGMAAAFTSRLTDDGLLPWLAFFLVSFGGWCLFCTAGHAPHHVARVTWRTIVLWTSYNPPLPSGRTLLEPYTYQMPEPWQLLSDRFVSLRLAVLALSVAVTATVSTSPVPANDEGPDFLHAAGEFLIDGVRHGLVLTLLPFLLFYTTLLVIHGTALTDYYGRFAASAVARAKRRSST